jgi:hypothetical protein
VRFAAKASKLGAVAPLSAILRTGTGAAQEQAAAAVASLSSAADNIEPLLEAGAVPALVHILKGGNRSATQLHAATALGNLAATVDGQMQVLRASGIQHLLALLSSPPTKEPAARALARMARDCLEAQKEINRNGGLAALLACIGFINEVHIYRDMKGSPCMGNGTARAHRPPLTEARARWTAPHHFYFVHTHAALPAD